MKRNLVIPAAILLIIGAVAIAIYQTTRDEDSDKTAKTDPASKRAAPGSKPGRSDSKRTRNPEPSSVREGRQSRQGELVEKYGGERTAKAQEVSNNVIALLDDVVAVSEMMLKGGQQFGGRKGIVNRTTQQMGIELNEEQQEKALALYDDWQRGEIEKSEQAMETLREDPSALMELFLAGDAKESGEMSEDEYAAVRDGAAGELAGIINPLDQQNFRGNRMVNNEELMNRFSGILDPEQQEKFSEYREKQEADSGDQPPRNRNISAIPTMPLEDLNEAVTGAQKMTSGFRSIMEGAGSLQQFRPQIEGGGNSGE